MIEPSKGLNKKKNQKIRDWNAVTILVKWHMGIKQDALTDITKAAQIGNYFAQKWVRENIEPQNY